MITISHFSKPEEAHLLRLRLEAGGVTAYIQDENIVQMDWLLSNAIGGVRVQISEQDIEEAREILQQPQVEDVSPDSPTCPKCLSHHAAPDELLRRMSFLSILLLNIPLPLRVSKTKLRCHDCGHVWNIPKMTQKDAAANP